VEWEWEKELAWAKAMAEEMAGVWAQKWALE
jgi:hypothetical protein